MTLENGEFKCQRCVEKGCHECVTPTVIDGVATCVFCEDGVPCPIQQQRKSFVEPAAAPSVTALKGRNDMPYPNAKCKGCGKGVRKDSPGHDTQICRKCFKELSAEPSSSKKKPGSKPKQAPVVLPEMAAKVPLSSSSPTTASLTFTEPQIDRMFVVLPINDKVQLLQEWLARSQPA